MEEGEEKSEVGKVVKGRGELRKRELVEEGEIMEDRDVGR